MVSFMVRLRFNEEQMETVVEMLRHLTTASRQEPGCVSYICHVIEGDPTTVLIYEQYTDEAAHEAHRSSPHFKQYAVSGLYQLMKERSTETLTAVV